MRRAVWEYLLMPAATATDTQTTHAAAMIVAGDARLAAGDATAERLVHNLAACGGKPNMSAKPRVLNMPVTSQGRERLGDEIARITGVSLGTVKAQIHRARGLVKEALG